MTNGMSEGKEANGVGFKHRHPREGGDPATCGADGMDARRSPL